MLPSVENGPCDSTWVLALEEKRFGFAVLEAEDLAITADIELALCRPNLVSHVLVLPFLRNPPP